MSDAELLFWLIAVVYAVVMVWLGRYIGRMRGRPGLGTLLAFLLGPIEIGVLVMIEPYEPPKRKSRPSSE